MRVLDVGSGTGVVAFHAAELVGRSGEVIGTDLAPEAVATGNKNAAELGLSHVSFRQGNPVEMVSISLSTPLWAATFCSSKPTRAKCCGAWQNC